MALFHKGTAEKLRVVADSDLPVYAGQLRWDNGQVNTLVRKGILKKTQSGTLQITETGRQALEQYAKRNVKIIPRPRSEIPSPQTEADSLLARSPLQDFLERQLWGASNARRRGGRKVPRHPIAT